MIPGRGGPVRIVVAGGTGFIGRALVADLLRAGHEVIVLTRRGGTAAEVGWSGSEVAKSDSIRFVQWDPEGAGSGAGDPQGRDSGALDIQDVVDGADVVVNLAGSTIATRWTATNKRRIVQSRIAATRALVRTIRAAKNKPKVFVSASAVGYYGPRGDEDVTETSPSGDDFLAEVCRRWEAEAMEAAGIGRLKRTGATEVPAGAGGAEDVGLRVVLARFGLVLGDGGALQMMALPFRLFAGGPLGSGRQWMPWIHIDDAVGMLRFAIRNGDVRGPLNVTGPAPLRNRQFAKVLGRVMGRPAFMPAPAFAMRFVLGEMADMVLTGQRALPERATEAGFRFRHEDAESALRAVFDR